MINEYAYQRFPLMKAFRRLFVGDLPQGCTGLNKDAVMQYSAELYRIDGQISYDRAKLLGGIIRSLSSSQKTAINNLIALNGVGNWNNTLSPLGKPDRRYHSQTALAVGGQVHKLMPIQVRKRLYAASIHH